MEDKLQFLQGEISKTGTTLYVKLQKFRSNVHSCVEGITTRQDSQAAILSSLTELVEGVQSQYEEMVGNLSALQDQMVGKISALQDELAVAREEIAQLKQGSDEQQSATEQLQQQISQQVASSMASSLRPGRTSAETQAMIEAAFNDRFQRQGAVDMQQQRRQQELHSTVMLQVDTGGTAEQAGKLVLEAAGLDPGAMVRVSFVAKPQNTSSYVV